MWEDTEFLRAPGHQRAQSGGMGLGLAYYKRAVETHSGTITVDSKIREGTTFTIKIHLKFANFESTSLP